MLHENFNPSKLTLISQKLNTIIRCKILTSNIETTTKSDLKNDIKNIIIIIIIIIMLGFIYRECKSDASGSRCIEFSVKEAGRPLGATRN